MYTGYGAFNNNGNTNFAWTQLSDQNFYHAKLCHDETRAYIGLNTRMMKYARHHRAIIRSPYSTQILESLNWIPIENTLKNRETTMTFKALTNRLPDYVRNLFKKCENCNYSLRSNNIKLSLPKPKAIFLKRSFSYRAAQGWKAVAKPARQFSHAMQIFPCLQTKKEINF